MKPNINEIILFDKPAGTTPKPTLTPESAASPMPDTGYFGM